MTSRRTYFWRWYIYRCKENWGEILNCFHQFKDFQLQSMITWIDHISIPIICLDLPIFCACRKIIHNQMRITNELIKETNELAQKLHKSSTAPNGYSAVLSSLCILLHLVTGLQWYPSFKGSSSLGSWLDLFMHLYPHLIWMAFGTIF